MRSPVRSLLVPCRVALLFAVALVGCAEANDPRDDDATVADAAEHDGGGADVTPSDTTGGDDTGAGDAGPDADPSDVAEPDAGDASDADEDGAGDCVDEDCPDGFACLDDGACRTECAELAHCAAGFFCEDGGCVPTLEDGAECADDGECESGHCGGGWCCAGEGDCCGGESAQCNDGNVCTDDVCNDAFQCESVDNTEVCAVGSCDGLTWTPPGVCRAGACVELGEPRLCATDDPCNGAVCTPEGCALEPAFEGAVCEDGSCDGLEFTQPRTCAGGECVDGGSVTCPTDDPCRVPICTSEGCALEDAVDGVECAPVACDGDTVTAARTCLSGACVGGGETTVCPSGGPCQVGVCLTDGSCGFEAAGDGIECEASSCSGATYTAPSTCDAGACVAGVEEVCRADEPCVVAACTDDGCTSEPSTAGVCGFVGDYSGTYDGTCPGFGGVAGTLDLSMDADGMVTGAFGGFDSGDVEGAVNDVGEMAMTGRGVLAGSCTFAGTATGAGASGTWTCPAAGCAGTWMVASD